MPHAVPHYCPRQSQRHLPAPHVEAPSSFVSRATVAAPGSCKIVVFRCLALGVGLTAAVRLLRRRPH
eukprot:614926-Alexandrium_andersonii.AAC.1